MSTVPPTVQELKHAAVMKESQTTLDRTTSQILRGASNTPVKQLNPEQQLVLEKARVRQDYIAGRISTDQALGRLGLAGRKWEVQAAERTTALGQKAARAGKSETTKQDESRELAARQGVAIGTINRDNSAKSSKSSQVSQNAKVSNFIETNKTTTQAQRESQVKVTTPDGKERTFKDRATAEKFVSRVDGNYQIQGPSNVLQHEVTLSEGKRKKSDIGIIGSLEYNFSNQEKQNNKKYNELQSGSLFTQGVESLFHSGEQTLDVLQQQKLKKDERPYSTSLQQLLYSGVAANQVIWKGLGDLINAGEFVSPLIRSGALELTDKLKQTSVNAFGKPSLASVLLEKSIIAPSKEPTTFNAKGKVTSDTEVIPISDTLQFMGFGEWSKKQSEFINQRGIVAYSSQIGAGWGLGVEAAPTLARSVGSKIISASPIKVLSPKIGETTVYKGIGVAVGKNTPKPLIGFREGKILLGEKSLADQVIKTAKTTGRYGGEVVLQSNPSGQMIVSKKTISDLVESGYINKVSGIRAETRQAATYSIQKGGKDFKGTLEPTEFKSSPEEAEHISKVTKKLQEQGDIDVLGGSPVVVSSLSKDVKQGFPYYVKVGDFDIHPLLTSGDLLKGVTLEEKADWLVKVYRMDYPVPKGSKIETTHQLGKNRQLNIIESSGKKRKPVEIVMVNAKQEALTGISKSTDKEKQFILQYELKKNKTKFTAEYNIETFTLKDQELTNVKTGLNLRDWELTAGKSSWVSGLTDNDIQFHHLIKKGPNETGILLTKDEHLGITALQGQLGKIKQPKGSDIVLDMIGERKSKSLPPSHGKKLSDFLSVAENRQLVQNVLYEAASQVKDPKKFKGMPLKKDSVRLSQKILKRETVFGEPVEYKKLNTTHTPLSDYGPISELRNKFDKSIGSSIKFGDEGETTWGFRYQGNTRDVYLNTDLDGAMKKIQEEKLEDIIAHETTHNILERIEGKQTSAAFDNLVYAHEPTVEKVKGLSKGRIRELSVPTIKNKDIELAEQTWPAKIKFEENAIRWQELDQPAKKMLYPQPGREAKDTARDLMATYQTAENQKMLDRVGAEKTLKIAKKFESIYPEIPFRSYRDTDRNIRFVDDTPHGMDQLRIDKNLLTPLTTLRPKENKPPKVKPINTSYPQNIKITKVKSTSLAIESSLLTKPSKNISSVITNSSLTKPSKNISSSRNNNTMTRKNPSYNISVKNPSYLFPPKVQTTTPRIPPPLRPSITYPRPPTTPPKPPFKNPPTAPPVSRLPYSRASQTIQTLSRMESKKKPAALIFNIQNATKKAPGIKQTGHDFLGGTRVAQITGWRTTKSDITVGDKKTEKLYRVDMLKTKRSYKKSDRKNTKNLLGKSASTMLRI